MGEVNTGNDSVGSPSYTGSTILTDSYPSVGPSSTDYFASLDWLWDTGGSTGINASSDLFQDTGVTPYGTQDPLYDSTDTWNFNDDSIALEYDSSFSPQNFGFEPLSYTSEFGVASPYGIYDYNLDSMAGFDLREQRDTMTAGIQTPQERAQEKHDAWRDGLEKEKQDAVMKGEDAERNVFKRMADSPEFYAILAQMGYSIWASGEAKKEREALRARQEAFESNILKEKQDFEQGMQEGQNEWADSQRGGPINTSGAGSVFQGRDK